MRRTGDGALREVSHPGKPQLFFVIHDIAGTVVELWNFPKSVHYSNQAIMTLSLDDFFANIPGINKIARKWLIQSTNTRRDKHQITESIWQAFIGQVKI